MCNVLPRVVAALLNLSLSCLWARARPGLNNSPMKVLKLCRLETMNCSIDACLKGLSGRAPNTFAKILKTGAVDKHWGETCVSSGAKACKTLASGLQRTELNCPKSILGQELRKNWPIVLLLTNDCIWKINHKISLLLAVVELSNAFSNYYCFLDKITLLS